MTISGRYYGLGIVSQDPKAKKARLIIPIITLIRNRNAKYISTHFSKPLD